MNRIISFILLVSLLLTACSTSVSPVSTSEPVEETPAPYPDTPSPAEINASLVESPSLISINFVNFLDGWGVTETQIVRTNDGGSTWYNVTPPNVSEANTPVKRVCYVAQLAVAGETRPDDAARGSPGLA